MAAEPKTRPTKASVEKFLGAIAEEERQADCRAIDAMMRKATGCKPVMWGEHIVGYGTQDTVYANGRTLDWPIIGFSPRKRDISIYLTRNLDEYAASLARLGKYKRGGGCLYINRLKDVDTAVLAKMIASAVTKTKKK
jgi:hypothetical protein